MTHRRPLGLCTLLLLIAHTASAQTATLSYSSRVPAKFTYVFADTTESVIGTPMGQMASSARMGGKVDIDMTPQNDSVHVMMQPREWGGSIEAMGQAMPVPEIPMKTVELMLSRSGQVRVIAGEIPGFAAMRGTGASDDVLSRSFIRLPEGEITVGRTWTDTLTMTIDTLGMRMVVTGTTTYTYAGDSALDGRRVHVVRAVTAMTMAGGGAAGGTEMRQDLKGSGSHTWLWDPQRMLFVSMRGVMDTTGTMDMGGMGTMDVNAKSRHAVTFVERT